MTDEKWAHFRSSLDQKVNTLTYSHRLQTAHMDQQTMDQIWDDIKTTFTTTAIALYTVPNIFQCE